MLKIAPSILAANFGKLDHEILSIDKAGCEYIHCDIMDGHFVNNISFGPEIVKTIKKRTKKTLDIHLMIEPVSDYIDEFVKAGADIISFHVEAERDPINIIKKIRRKGIKAGLAIKPKTPVENIIKFLKYIDVALILTVEPGFGGQKFMKSQLSKISQIRRICKDRSLKIDIEVDGGVNKHTAKLCTDAGANILVAGSYIFGSKTGSYKDKIDSLR